jgi:Domain of unknown function (DUF4388)
VKLEGTLQTFPLRELIDMIIYSSVTGVLNLYDTESTGHIYVRDGHLYHADQYGLRGVDALAAMLELPSTTRFAFVSELTIDEESIWGDAEFHLQSAERTAVRWRHVRPIVRNMALVPRALLSPEVALNRAGPSLQPLLTIVDGRLSLHQIAAQLGWSDLDTAEAVARLRQAGVLELGEADHAGEPVLVADEPMRHSDGGLFSRLRAKMGRVAGVEAEPTRGDELIFQILRS